MATFELTQKSPLDSPLSVNSHNTRTRLVGGQVDVHGMPGGADTPSWVRLAATAAEGGGGGVVVGGQVDLHGMPGGADTPSWVRLAATAAAGQRQLIVEGDVRGWRPGLSIAVASTSTNFNEAESREIGSATAAAGQRQLTVEGDVRGWRPGLSVAVACIDQHGFRRGREPRDRSSRPGLSSHLPRITLTSPLAHTHEGTSVPDGFGGTVDILALVSPATYPPTSRITLTSPLAHTHEGTSVPDGFGGMVDIRAEVALLDRQIVIQGTDELPPHQYDGGHFVVYMTRTQEAIEGIQFRGLGNQGTLGRYYPLHYTSTCAASLSSPVIPSSPLLQAGTSCPLFPEPSFPCCPLFPPSSPPFLSPPTPPPLPGGHFMVYMTRTPQAIEGVQFRGLGNQGTLGRYPLHFHVCRLPAENNFLSPRCLPSPPNRRALHGGHFMVYMTRTPQTIEGVQFRGLGNQGTLGRYPLHFHVCGLPADASQPHIVRKNAIVHSKQRCMVIHATSNMNIEDNITYETKGHCYLVEEGSEMGNVFRRNLGMSVRKVEKEIPPDTSDQYGFHTDKQPSVFWMATPYNSFYGNVAAGSENSGHLKHLTHDSPGHDGPLLAGGQPHHAGHLPTLIFWLEANPTMRGISRLLPAIGNKRPDRWAWGRGGCEFCPGVGECGYVSMVCGGAHPTMRGISRLLPAISNAFGSLTLVNPFSCCLTHIPPYHIAPASSHPFSHHRACICRFNWGDYVGNVAHSSLFGFRTYPHGSFNWGEYVGNVAHSSLFGFRTYPHGSQSRFPNYTGVITYLKDALLYRNKAGILFVNTDRIVVENGAFVENAYGMDISRNGGVTVKGCRFVGTLPSTCTPQAGTAAPVPKLGLQFNAKAMAAIRSSSSSSSSTTTTTTTSSTSSSRSSSSGGSTTSMSLASSSIANKSNQPSATAPAPLSLSFHGPTTEWEPPGMADAIKPWAQFLYPFPSDDGGDSGEDGGGDYDDYGDYGGGAGGDTIAAAAAAPSGTGRQNRDTGRSLQAAQAAAAVVVPQKEIGDGSFESPIGVTLSQSNPADILRPSSVEHSFFSGYGTCTTGSFGIALVTNKPGGYWNTAFFVQNNSFASGSKKFWATPNPPATTPPRGGLIARFYALRDLDGSLLGTPGAFAVAPFSPILPPATVRPSLCQYRAESAVWQCQSVCYRAVGVFYYEPGVRPNGMQGLPAKVLRPYSYINITREEDGETFTAYGTDNDNPDSPPAHPKRTAYRYVTASLLAGYTYRLTIIPAPTNSLFYPTWAQLWSYDKGGCEGGLKVKMVAKDQSTQWFATDAPNLPCSGALKYKTYKEYLCPSSSSSSSPPLLQLTVGATSYGALATMTLNATSPSSCSAAC
ncbi:unnamed protein product [Closterium sp. NIES-65]|nr:unnamed protein product [Closterium sp. NIES-65]